jgi:4-hydroxy 2-oxovalerate aldolase
VVWTKLSLACIYSREKVTTIIMNIKTKIMDCTLRDGSYVNNFQFTLKDTKKICEKLDQSGIEFIEVGHGIGLGASRNTKFKAKESDVNYCKAAKESTKKSKLGVFAIPNIASLDDIRKAKDNGMDFVRIGTNVENYKDAVKFIELARKLNLLVCVNFMKSYVLNPNDFSILCNNAYNSGGQIIYIVDSAGGMLTEEIENYYKYIKKKNKKINIGFHGHDNLGLALKNTLKACDMNFSIVDTSLQGLGRSAGNCSTEQLLAVLKKKGIGTKIDYFSLIDFSEKYIAPIIKNKHIKSIDLISGISMFHSSYLPLIEKYSKKYKVDPRRLIELVSKVSKSDAEEKTVNNIAKIISKKNIYKKSSWKKIYNHFYINEQNL